MVTGRIDRLQKLALGFSVVGVSGQAVGVQGDGPGRDVGSAMGSRRNASGRRRACGGAGALALPRDGGPNLRATPPTLDAATGAPSI